MRDPSGGRRGPVRFAKPGLLLAAAPTTRKRRSRASGAPHKRNVRGCAGCRSFLRRPPALFRHCACCRAASLRSPAPGGRARSPLSRPRSGVYARGPFRPLPGPAPGRSPRLLRSASCARLRAPRALAGPVCSGGLPLLRCGLPGRSALLRRGRAVSQRVALPGPPLAVRCAASGPGCSRPGAVGGLAAAFAALRPPGV